jgi:hypothetical protein
MSKRRERRSRRKARRTDGEIAPTVIVPSAAVYAYPAVPTPPEFGFER